MPNPADLPPELFNLILTHALDRSDLNFKCLCGLSLLSRAWYSALIGLIYGGWSFNGARQPFLTLWKYLLTILRDPQLASAVRTLKIGNWGFFPEAAKPGPDVQLPKDELDLVFRAYRDLGLGGLEGDVVKALRRRDRRPLMAILLTRLPNLETIFAHVPREDPYLAAVLERVVQGQSQDESSEKSSALASLRELHLCQETPVDPPSYPEDSDPDSDDEESVSREALRLEHLWAVFHLRGLRVLTLLDLDTARAATWLGNHGSAVSNIEHLYLINNWRTRCEGLDIEALISQPKALKTLELKIHDNPFDPRRNHTISNSELWACLQKHSATLENIDISRSKDTHRDENGHFGRLRDFSRLRHLHIQAEMILGGCCGSAPAPFRLRDTLPFGIEEIKFYGEEGFSKLNMSDQLREVIDDISLFPSLTYISLDEMDFLFGDDGELTPAYQEIERLCEERRVYFWPHLLYGAPEFMRPWGKLLDMQDDGTKRNEFVLNKPKRIRDWQELLLSRSHVDVDVEDVLDDDTDEDDDGDTNFFGDEDLSFLSEPPQVLYTVPFHDHTGETAHMVFENNNPLPPLFSFAIYLTHPSASIDTKTDTLVALYNELKPGDFFGNVRFDIYILPGSSAEECVAHYQSEKESRGSYKNQIKAFRAFPKTAVPETQTPGRIPGMVNKYPLLGPYRSLLFILPWEDWRAPLRLDVGGNNNTTPTGLLQVEFDRKNISLQNARWTGAREEQNLPPPVLVSGPHRLTHSTPIHGAEPEQFRRRWTIRDKVLDLSHQEKDKYEVPWKRATKWGWTGWV
ncbi:hypothetical protein BDV06DRAFT_230930 [Aspergillus oleicola]